MQLCSAMDAIGDTQLAVRAFLDEPMTDIREDGWSYIAVYGVLQVLYVQQDAVRTLSSCLALKFELPDELTDIRDIRNDSIGHPTGRGAMISRISLSPEGFQLLIASKGKTELRHVSVRGVAEKQTEAIAAILARAVEQLVADELAHRRDFRDKPLRDLLPGTLQYGLEKIAEALRDPTATPLGLGGLDSIGGAVVKFKEGIEERGLTDAYKDSVGETVAEVEFVLGRLESRLKGAVTEWADRDADVYWFFLDGKLEELQKLADEIDRDYASEEVN